MPATADGFTSINVHTSLLSITSLIRKTYHSHRKMALFSHASCWFADTEETYCTGRNTIGTIVGSNRSSFKMELLQPICVERMWIEYSLTSSVEPHAVYDAAKLNSESVPT